LSLTATDRRSLPPVSARFRRVAASLLPPAAYALIALVLFWRPIWRDLSSAVVAQDETDSSAFQWFLAWWPHALLHGINPFITKVILVPDGYNLTWATGIPGPAVVLAPITEVFGPTVSFNLLALSAAPLSGWAAYALCRHVTGSTWASAVAGFLFGFSPYLLEQARGAPNLALVALVPVFALLTIRSVDGTLSSRRFLVLMTAALAFQFLIFPEILATAAVFGGIALVMAWLLLPGERRALGRTVKLLALCCAGTAVILAPFLLFMLKAHTPPVHADPGAYSVDLTSLVTPGEVVWTGAWQSGLWTRLGLGHFVSGSSAFGLPLLVLLGAFAYERRRDRTAVLALVCLAVFVIASLGPHLLVFIKPRFPLPWAVFTHVPLLRYALPTRFALYSWLAVAIIVAIWLSTPGRTWARWALGVLVVASLAPHFGSLVWRAPANDPAFFIQGRAKSYLHANDNVLTIPAVGQNARWQARSGFSFRVVGGYLGAFPSSYSRFPAWRMTVLRRLTPDYARQVRAYVAAKDVTVIVVDQRIPGPWRQLFAPLGVRPREDGGTLIYRLVAPGRGDD
jgi:hypothetical protein